MALSPTAGLLGCTFSSSPYGWVPCMWLCTRRDQVRGSLALSQACCPATATAGTEALLFLQAWQPQFASVQLVSMGALYTSAGCSPDEYVSHLPAPCPYLVVSSSAGPSFSTGFIKAASGEAQAQGYPTSELYP